MRKVVALAATSVVSAKSTKKRTVPNVVGKTEAIAKTDITAAYCKVGTVANVTSKTVKKGEVISESPEAGSKETSGAKVSLKVSKGK